MHGPWWRLRPESPVHRDARRAAIADAVLRAREYAEAVGAHLVRLLEISDVGMGVQPPHWDRPISLGFRSDTAGEAQPGLPLDPQVQMVHAEVEARFAMSEPAGLADVIG